MPSLAIALPCLPGGSAKLRQIAEELRTKRAAEFAEFHKRIGLEREHWFVQATPNGELCLVVLEGDPAGAIGKLAASDHPFDRWFKAEIRQVHGVDFNQPPPGPISEPVFSG